MDCCNEDHIESEIGEVVLHGTRRKIGVPAFI